MCLLQHCCLTSGEVRLVSQCMVTEPPSCSHQEVGRSTQEVNFEMPQSFCVTACLTGDLRRCVCYGLTSYWCPLPIATSPIVQRIGAICISSSAAVCQWRYVQKGLWRTILYFSRLELQCASRVVLVLLQCAMYGCRGSPCWRHHCIQCAPFQEPLKNYNFCLLGMNITYNKMLMYFTPQNWLFLYNIRTCPISHIVSMKFFFSFFFPDWLKHLLAISCLLKKTFNHDRNSLFQPKRPQLKTVQSITMQECNKAASKQNLATICLAVQDVLN